MPDTRQAFTGLRIIDFTQVLAGPFATQQLAQLGADVIKIEQPEAGDITRGLMSSGSDGMAPSFLTCNLGKRAITLDLKHPKAKEIVHRLVASADAVVENFKPGTIDKLGFGYEALKAIKPDLVYASISGYGQSGPKSELPAFDGAIQASSGMMSISGHPESGPTRTGYFSVDMSTALNAAFAISAALFRRHLTGEGQRIDVSMLDTAVVMQAAQMSNYLVTNTLPELMGNRSPTKSPTANVFASADGFVQIVALREAHVKALFTLLGVADMYDTYPEPAIRIAHTDEINAVIKPALAAQSSAHWISELGKLGIPCAPIQTLDEVAAEPQFDHRLIFTEIPNPQTPDASVKVVSAGHVSEPAPPKVQRPSPSLGQDNDNVLGELGYSEHDIAELRAQRVI
ncbi:MAG: CoA transferase [Pseudomonadota bacterium]|nr:CoA transferase [Pseudomonadota bacterium]MEC7413701.1 CoA transferase [Pseudomonadota bacterium]MEC8059737.1 CoA transferase [Pseudomonadota bacterium]MEC8695687.1 CoA transferase [Pseudomonadota bacterium]|tara:strand:+ start:152 stop:1351 length:1200 start_codon:yes stop_codon:yes gene_type:complete